MNRRDFLTLLAGVVVAPVAITVAVDAAQRPPRFVAGGFVDPPDEHVAILHRGESVMSRRVVDSLEQTKLAALNAADATDEMRGAAWVMQWIIDHPPK